VVVAVALDVAGRTHPPADGDENVRRRWIAAVVAVLAVVASLAVGCRDSNDVSSGTPTTTGPEPVGGLLAEIGTNRLYAVHRAFGLALQNVGDEPIVVRQVQLTSNQFATLPITDRDVTLEPGGRRFVVPLPYGEVRCDEEPTETFDVVVVVNDGEELHLPATE
jgi:hypothetical protein